jgi:WD40 repeat protein
MGDFLGLEPITWEFPKEDIRAMALQPDGVQVALGLDNGTILIRDRTTGADLAELPGPSSRVVSLSFAADGRKLASGAIDGTLKVWQADPGSVWSCTRTIKIDGPTRPRAWVGLTVAVALTPDGKFLAACTTDQSAVSLWSLADEEAPPTLLRGPGEVELCCVAFNPKGDVLAVGCAGPREATGVLVWKLATPQSQPTLLPSSDSVLRVAFSQDNQLLVAACVTGGVVVFDTANFQRHLFMGGDCVFGVAISHDGKFIAMPGRHGGAITLWNVLRNREVAVLKHAKQADWVAFSTDGRTLITANRQSVRIWNLAGSGEKLVVYGHHQMINKVAFSPDGELLASRGIYGPVQIWDPATGRLRHELAVSSGGGITFSPDGGLFAAADAGSIRIWEVPSWQELPVPIPERPFGIIPSIDFSPDGKYLAAGSNTGAGTLSGLILWKVRVRTADEAKGPRFVLEKPDLLSDHPARSLCFSPDGKLLASVERGEQLPNRPVNLTLHVRHLENPGSDLRLPAQVAGGAKAIEFLPNSRHLALIGPLGLPEVWDVATGERVWAFSGEKYEGGIGIGTIALSADGAWLAQSVMAPRVWDLENKRLLLVLPEGRVRSTCFAWSPNKERLAIAYADGELVIWNVPKMRAHLAKIGLDW